MTKKEFENIIPRLENYFLYSSYLSLKPYDSYYLHPNTWIAEGKYFICIKYKKITEIKGNNSVVDDNDIFYIHYKHVQKIVGLNFKSWKHIKAWEISESKLIPYRRIKIKRILKQLE